MSFRTKEWSEVSFTSTRHNGRNDNKYIKLLNDLRT